MKNRSSNDMFYICYFKVSRDVEQKPTISNRNLLHALYTIPPTVQLSEILYNISDNVHLIFIA